MTDDSLVSGEGAYLSGVCPDELCAGTGPIFYRIICETCHALGCDECVVDEGPGFICDNCRTVDSGVKPDVVDLHSVVIDGRTR